MRGAWWLRKVCLLVVVGSLFSSCIHKELCYDHFTHSSAEVEIVFDWSKAPKANPSEMNLYLFPEEGEPILYQFTNKSGGKIAVHEGKYKVIAFNNNDDEQQNIAGDNLSGIQMRGKSAFNTLEAFLQEEGGGNGSSHAYVSRTFRGSSEAVIRPGRQLWSASEQTIEVVNRDTPQPIVLYPEQRHITYKVIVEKVENPYVATGDGVHFEASLSSMMSGLLLGEVKPSTAPLSTIAFPLSKSNDSLKREIITLGENPTKGKDQEHTLTIYYTIPNGEKLYEEFKFKSSDSIVDASDPYSIVIRIPKLSLPKPLVIEETPIVINEWKKADGITITM